MKNGSPVIGQRRVARRLAYWNGALWALGNGLASSLLIVYLAMELDVPGLGLGISLILAAPRLVGLLRLGAPALIGRLASRKRFCLASYAVSVLFLSGVPAMRTSLWAIVALWCAYHLLEYLGTIALWSWLADLVPLRVRGRFLGRRQRWMVAGQMAAMLAGGLYVWGWCANHPGAAKTDAYAVLAWLGGGFLLAALVPLAFMPEAAAEGRRPRGLALARLFRPFADACFLRLVVFGCWFSFWNGISQLPQSLYPYRVLGFGLFAMLAMKAFMSVGQYVASPWTGRLADRWGNRPVMIVSLALVALGPLFYYAATPATRWWLVGAWVTWMAYAGLNVCLPNLMLKLSPPRENTTYIAAYFAVTGLCYAASTILGGMLFDRWHEASFSLGWGRGTWTLDFYQAVFLLGWLTRSMGVLLLFWVRENRAGQGACG